jgi:UDPglucose--hexose-1-phosphate uridylyltransferase
MPPASRLNRTELRQPDGRLVTIYGPYRPAPAGYTAPQAASGVYERRWNPLRREWVLVAAARQDRTYLPRPSRCPLCPSTARRSTEIPAADFRLAVFENRFPSLRAGGVSSGRPESTASAGVCEVLVYGPEHQGGLGSLAPDRVADLAEVWSDRYRVLGARRDVDYVFIFENRGQGVGVTLHHPHGQIYAYPFVPPVPAAELGAPAGAPCLVCAQLAAERRAGVRMLWRSAGVAAYVPAYARWPYEVHVVTASHRGSLLDLRAAGRRSFALALQRVARAYDRLFDVAMPYMMGIHQRPTDGRSHPQAHLHAEFYPILRDRGRLKFLAGSESGAGVFINDTLAEETAARLRKLID